MKYVVIFLAVLSLGHSAPLNDCNTLLQPITVSKEQILGKWVYIAGSSDLPGTRSFGRLLEGVVLDVTPTSQSTTLNILQTQRIKYGPCWSLSYNVTFENSTIIIDQPFYLKEIYLATCPDCLLAYEEITSGNDKFTSLLLFSRSRTVEPSALEKATRQAECLQMTPPVMVEQDTEICPHDIPPSAEGTEALNDYFESKMTQRIGRFLDAVFVLFGW